YRTRSSSPHLLCAAGGYVHDAGGPLSVRSHDELASVEGAKRSPVTHAKEGDVREPLAQEPVEARFGRLVQCRGRLVEEEPVGLLDEGTREGDPLLLARREPQRPVVGFIESSGQLRELHCRERLAQGRIVRLARKAHYVPQRADREVRLLRENEDPGAERQPDRAATEWPDAGDGADQRALPGARSSPEQHRVSAR